jgi:hypothetical protein
VEGDRRRAHVVLLAACDADRPSLKGRTVVRAQSWVMVSVVVAGVGAGSPRSYARVSLTSPTPSVWKTGPDGTPFRVSFDPGHRLLLGVATDIRAGVGASSSPSSWAPALEVGLLLRSEAPAPGWDVNWSLNQELLHLRLVAPHGERGTGIDGHLYRGLFLRQSREGTLTIPSSPPVSLPLPFDVGLLVEVGQSRGAVWPVTGGAPVELGVVHGEVLADFWRSHQPGRWLTAGIGARHDLGLSRDGNGALVQDHRIAPMTALSLAVHGERSDGLLAGGVRLEGAYRWSSLRGWERAYRVEADAEAIPLALNDRPLSVFTTASASPEPGTGAPDVRIVAGLRISQPLR